MSREKKLLHILALVACSHGVAKTWAQSTAPAITDGTVVRSAAEEDQRKRQQQEARERAQTVQSPGLRAPAPGLKGFPELPTEAPCFRISRFLIEVPSTLSHELQSVGASALPQDNFAFAQSWLDHYQGACVGKDSVALLTKGVSQLVLDHGYVTSRVLVPEQDLSTGTLRFSLVPGVIGQLRFDDENLWGTWRTAFPARPGDLLNLRDLEQGLEQMKRIASQDVDMQVVPTQTPGVSDVVIAIKRTKPWTVVTSVDNSGTRSTGRIQGNVSVGIDNPLGLNDLLNVGYSHDLGFEDNAKGTRGWNGLYSMPWGYWTGTISAYSNNYYQQIAGVNQTFISSGESQTLDFKLHRVIRRSQNDVLGLQFRLSKRFGKSFIEDTEIVQQRRNNTIVEVGLTDRHYFGAAQFDGTLSYRQGVDGLGAQDDMLAADGGPTWRYRMAVLDANLSAPFKLAGQALRYVTTFRGQFTNDRLYYIDAISIGSRYTVRGFDGESLLAGDRGFYWRNELQMPLGQSNQSMYAGLDYGRVYGPLTTGQAGRALAGAVVGFRGGLATGYGAVSYDLFVGTPVHKPEAFHTAGVAGGFQLTYQY